MRRLLILVFLIMLVPCLSMAVTRTVGPGKTYSTIQEAVDASSSGSGDIIEVYTGTYTDSQSLNYAYTSTGTVEVYQKHNLTIKAAPGNTPVLNGGGSVNMAFYVRQSDNITIDGFEITNYNPAGVGAYAGLIYIYDGQDFVVKNNYLHQTSGFPSGGEQVPAIHSRGGWTPSRPYSNDDGLIQNNIVDTPSTCIKLGTATANTVEGNYCSGQNSGSKNGIYATTGGQDGWQNNHIIRYNYFENYGQHGIWYRDGLGGQVYYNVVYNIGQYGINPHDQSGGGGGESGDEYGKYYNNVVDGASVGFLFAGQQYTEIINNIIINCSTAFTSAWLASSNMIISNNIAYNYSTLINESVGGWTSATKNNNQWGVNPQFVQGGSRPSPYYHLTSGSPAIDAGYSPTIGSRDYDGIPFFGIPDIGAFEYGGGPPADTTPDNFIFTPDITNATQSTVYTSNTITVTGIDDLTPIPITVVGNSAEFQKNSTGGWFTSGTVILNDTVTIRQTSSPTVNTAVNTVVTIGGVVDSGSPWTVTTGIFGIPNLTTPTSGSTDVARPVTFTWSLVSGKTVYNIQIDDAVDFVSPVIDVEVLTNSYTATTLLPSTQYWWRVRAR